jgi:hypothetical protein
MSTYFNECIYANSRKKEFGVKSTKPLIVVPSGKEERLRG